MIGGSDYATELSTLRPWADIAPAISVEERLARIEKARQLMIESGADALIVGASTGTSASLNYFTGIGWGMIERLVAMVLTRTGEPYLICPAFEYGSLEAVRILDARVRLWEEHESPSVCVAQILKDENCSRLAIDPALPFGMADGIAKAAPAVTLIDATAVIDGCRIIKSSAEIAILKQAMQMTLEVQRRAARILHVGIKASTVCAFINEAHKAIGSAGSTFCAVQFGRSTAFPHGLPQDDVLAENDMVLVDTGCLVQGYNSDLTRTYVFGAPDAEQQRIWNIEKQAQLAAFAAAKPGATCASVDDAARAVLQRHGLGPDYQLPGLPHRTGHGIGLTIHEAPYLVRGNHTLMRAGMCFSNEPMIVVPDKFGVRLEDHFYITETGAEWFTEPSGSITQPF